MKLLIYSLFKRDKKEINFNDKGDFHIVKILENNETFDFDEEGFDVYPGSLKRKFVFDFNVILKSNTKEFASIAEAKEQGYHLDMNNLRIENGSIIIDCSLWDYKEGWDRKRAEEFLSSVFKNQISGSFCSSTYLKRID